MKNTLITILGFLTFAPIVYGAFGDPFISIQLATDPDNGECLTTDGTDNVWSTCAGGGSFPFDVQSWGVSTTTTLGFLNGFLSTASSTFTGGFFANAGTTTNATSTNLNVSGNFYVSGLTSALTLTGSDGLFAEYAGTSCTNQFVRALSALGVATCATVGTADVSGLDISDDTNLTAGDALTLTGDDIDFDGGTSPGGELGGTWASPTIDDSLTVTGWNLGNSTSTTFAVTGISADNCLQTTTGGAIIGSGSACGSGSGGANSKWATSSADTLAIHTADALRVGIGTTTPKWALQIASSTGPQLTLSDPSTLTNLHWSVRNAGGNFYIASSSPSTFGTGTPMLSFSGNTRQIGIGTSTFDGNGYGITVDLPNPSLIFNSGANFVDRNANEVGTAGITFDGYNQVTGRNAASDVTSINWTTRKLTAGLAYQLNTRTAIGGTINTFSIQNLTGHVGIATTTPRWLLQIATSTAPQLTLTDGAGINHWSFRNAGGLFYLATSSPSTFATSTATALSINANGLLTVNQFKANDSLQIPNGTAPTVDAAGEIAVDTTSGQFKWYDGVRTHVITGTTSPALNLASTTMDANGKSFSVGTTSIHLKNSPEAMTLAGFYCKATSTAATTDTALIRFGDGTNWTTAGSCTTTGTFFPTSSNNTFTAYEDFIVQASSTEGAIDRLTITTVINKTAD